MRFLNFSVCLLLMSIVPWDSWKLELSTYAKRPKLLNNWSRLTTLYPLQVHKCTTSWVRTQYRWPRVRNWSGTRLRLDPRGCLWCEASIIYNEQLRTILWQYYEVHALRMVKHFRIKPSVAWRSTWSISLRERVETLTSRNRVQDCQTQSEQHLPPIRSWSNRDWIWTVYGIVGHIHIGRSYYVWSWTNGFIPVNFTTRQHHEMGSG